MNINPIGRFTEKDYGRYFEFGLNQGPLFPELPHIIDIDRGNYRYGKVLKTVAYIAVDEDAEGNPVLEKWNIKDHNIWDKA